MICTENSRDDLKIYIWDWKGFTRRAQLFSTRRARRVRFYPQKPLRSRRSIAQRTLRELHVDKTF